MRFKMYMTETGYNKSVKLIGTKERTVEVIADCVGSKARKASTQNP